MHHPIETDHPVNVLRARNGCFVRVGQGSWPSVSDGRNEDLTWVKTVEFTFEVENVELHSPVGLQASHLQNLVLIDLSSLLKHVLPRISTNQTASCRIWCAVTCLPY